MTRSATDETKMSVEIALISGVMPRRRRAQISRGKVLSRPIRKNVTAISSIESVKMSSPAAINESLRLGRVMRQNVCQGVAPRSSEASSCARSSFCRPAKRSEEHTSELQSQFHLVCRLLLEKKKKRLTQHQRAARLLASGGSLRGVVATTVQSATRHRAPALGCRDYRITESDIHATSLDQ